MSERGGVADLRRHYDGRPVAVTGGASFIGSHLVERLVGWGARVTVADDLSSGREEHLASCRDEVDLLIGDLRDPAVAARAVRGADTVFHLAARHGGRGYIDSHPVACVGNAALDHTVLSALADAGVGTVVYASSACAYPVDTSPLDGAPGRLSEAAAGFGLQGQAFADGEYGWAKLFGELQLAAFAKERGVAAIACRLFNAYGERENESHAVVALIARALARCDPYLIWGPGTQQRAFTYVGDTVTGLALAGTQSGHDVFNVGNGGATSIDDLCAAIFQLVGWAPEEIRHDLTRPVGSHARIPDNGKVVARFGWEPSTPLTEGLRRTIEDCEDRWRRGRLVVEDDPLVTIGP